MNAVLQHWLLNLAVDFAVPLELLPPVLDGDDREPHALNVKSLRGVSLFEGVAHLVELAENGLIAFRRDGGLKTLAPPTVLPLLKNPAAERKISFELTGDGGHAWEKASEPRWHDMAAGSAVVISGAAHLYQWNWTWFSQDREQLMAVLGWYPMLQNEQIDFTTVKWELHAEYQVKYWKRLSNVHVVSFRSCSLSRSIPAWPRAIEPEWFTDRRKSRDNWCRKPWNMEGWPPVR
jgi:hypothetical protein